MMNNSDFALQLGESLQPMGSTLLLPLKIAKNVQDIEDSLVLDGLSRPSAANVAIDIYFNLTQIETWFPA